MFIDHSVANTKKSQFKRNYSIDGKMFKVKKKNKKKRQRRTNRNCKGERPYSTDICREKQPKEATELGL